jgi:hypothetical protein
MHSSTGITTHDDASSALPMLSSIINNNTIVQSDAVLPIIAAPLKVKLQSQILLICWETERYY